MRCNSINQECYVFVSGHCVIAQRMIGLKYFASNVMLLLLYSIVHNKLKTGCMFDKVVL